MASVKKLMLIPADEWARLLKKSGEKEAVGTRSVDIPAAEQLGGGGGERRRNTEEPPVGPNPAMPPSSSPFPSPSSPSREEEEEREEGEGKGRRRGEGGGGGGEGDARKYMEREDSGKENNTVTMRKNAGVWRPPGRPSDVSTSRKKRAWINI